ncbi:rna polymerase ii subunit a domain phosphatase [Ophiostoma piceae UAMH 11346]|uniref:RNA polymerase II subunit A C-terminal domain phosphatase n=1 Tax=Ophiostoma piceae (strain UAMH 11346) TaxID=1262450 RepID=S3BSX3_OPHP1|nr:rna polymerase ii subunit a domain phosphatase [Ophiostoma piceae UAMH 11346]
MATGKRGEKALQLGARLKYPIRITKLYKRPGDMIKRQEPVLQYSYEYTMELPHDRTTLELQTKTLTSITDWDAPEDGKLLNWNVRVGDVVFSDRVCVTVEEACTHEVQFQGLCALCGKDMNEVNWASEQRDTDRAPINMTHDQTSLTVSRVAATRAESELQRRLLGQRKLSLVVDLDQTIIHACIDPTIGEWQKDPTNPNYEAVRDVQQFQLEEGQPQGGVARGCFYYIKMRPGLKEFLTKIATMFELHVYTMGTRTYATNIAKIVDPDQRLFGNRVISRDENGNMVAKSLQRIFPVSTHMAVIIDDRADVWPYNRHNLIKVPGVGESMDVVLLQKQTEEQERTIEKQIKDRPLQHMQEQLDKEDQEAAAASSSSERHCVLYDDDTELSFLQEHLTQLHSEFFKAYETKKSRDRRSKDDLAVVPDAGEILDRLKAEVLSGTTVVLSGLVPNGIDVARSEIGMQALSFGANLQTRVSKRTTHLVVSSDRPRTEKVRQAARISTVKIVNQNWLIDCFSQWKKLDDAPYLVEVHPSDRNRSSKGTPADATDTEAVSDADSDAGLQITIPGNGTGEEDEFKEFDDSDPASPLAELGAFDWGAADDELASFLAEDEDDDDDDGETDAATTDGENEPEDVDMEGANGVSVGGLASKRKYTGSSQSTNGNDTDTDNDSDRSVSSKSGRGRVRVRGIVAKRQKLAASRSRSSSRVPTSALAAAEGGHPLRSVASTEDVVKNGEDDIDVDDDELMAEFMAAESGDSEEA